MAEQTHPFRIEVPDGDLEDLRDRLMRARWAPGLVDSSGDYGVAVERVRELADYWLNHYDWRAWEARLNSHPQFTTRVDGTNIHFLHVRSPEQNAIPLILSHGWPGSVAEFLDVIGPLSDPRRHELDPALAFDLVIPSLPGFGWSGPTPDTGWGPRRIAKAWAALMRRLGYRRYGAAGNDWGTYISAELGRSAPNDVVGVHVTQLFSLPDGDPGFYPPTAESVDLAALSPDDQAALAFLRSYQQTMASYGHVQAQQPHTLAHALTDSPVGLLGWNSQCMPDLDTEMLLTHVSTHWLTLTAGTALRIYADHQRQQPATEPTTVPVGLASFANDMPAIRAFAERDHANIVSWNTYDSGGHYAARQEPALLVGDIRGFFGAVVR
jgi:pimeloyl-ACP methyl ester carboxylesterase